jgi:hypothetical protein
MPAGYGHIRYTADTMRILVIAILLTLGCSDMNRTESTNSASDNTNSSIRFADTGLESLNSYCPVTGQELSLAIEPIYVNGRPIGFC